MAALNAGVYRSKGPISKFKLRFRLEKRTVAGTVQAPIAGSAQDASQPQNRDIELQEIPSKEKVGVAVVEAEERIVGWQEKILSSRELLLYADKSNCHTARHQEYHQLITSNKQKPSKWLFTYIDDDNVPTKDELLTCKRTGTESLTVPALNADCLRQRRTSNSQGKSAGSIGGGGRRWFAMPKGSSVVNEVPTKMQQTAGHSLSATTRVMRIMADLRSTEVVVCTVRVDENSGVVRIEPDFRRDPPYPLELDFDGIEKVTYCYTIEHVSEPVDEQEHQRENNIQNELYARHKVQLSTLVGHDFESVSPHAVATVHVFGEIVGAANFEYDDLYVNYFVEAAHGGRWILVNENDELPAYATTHTSSVKWLDHRPVAYFGHPFYFRMTEVSDKGNAAARPRVMFQVMSWDAWRRFRTEGYGYSLVPTKPGHHTFQIRTWRPVALTLSGQLRNFFVGGSPELDDLSAVGVPSTHQGSILSKYGIQTETMGTLTVRMHIVHQRQLDNDDMFISYGTGNLQAGHSFGMTSSLSTSLQTSVAAVLEAFHRARRRMLAARERLNL